MDPRMMPVAVPLDALFAMLAGPPPAPAPTVKAVAGFARKPTPPAPATRKVSSKVVGFATAA